MAPKQSDVHNRILRLLPASEYRSIARHLEHLELPKEFSIAEPDRRPEFIYFFEHGICSIVASSPEGQKSEAGIFGRDSFGPAGVANGVEHNVLDTYVQVAGEGYRLPTTAFITLLAENAELRRLAQISAYLLTVQTAFTSLSNAVHQVDERLARWLLMCHDRMVGDEIALTHEFISLMLAVRRPSVTTALHNLEGLRFIRAERGVITIRDRQGLQDFAVDAYGAPEREYTRLLGPIR